MTKDVKDAPGVRAPLVWVAELFSVLSAAGFLTSIWMHHTVFQSWGVSYFQVATPGDVLMGGISTVALALGLLPSLAAGALVALALHGLSRLFRPVRPWLDWLIGLAGALTAYAMLRNGIAASWDGAVLAVFAYGGAATWLLCRLSTRFAPARFQTAVLIGLFLGLAVSLAYACGQRITSGFGGDADFAQTSPTGYELEGSCESEKIVWIGQRALVVRCSGLVTETTGLELGEVHLVLLNPGALWFGNAERMATYEQDRTAYERRDEGAAAPSPPAKARVTP